MRYHSRTSLTVILLVSAILHPLSSRGQTTISTGSIVGTVTDPSGAVVPGARVMITNEATGQVNNTLSNSSGLYNSAALLPGDYKVTVIANGFKRASTTLVVSVGVTTNGDTRLEVGESRTIIEVTAAAVQVDTSQAIVQGTVTSREIRELPVNGRNFLDLAGLQPGVQIQDGVSFDPTKNGFSSVSFAGRFGRTARIELNGGDISDETVGTTTLNLPQSAIEEFQVEQSSLDMSTELTSSGAINVTTKSGTNKFHGDALFSGRWHNTAARMATQDVFFRRAQWGTDFGGPLLKDKLFFFLDWERSRQDLFVPVQFSVPFSALSGGFNGPFREHQLLGRLDWEVKPSWRVFFQTLYNENRNVASMTPNSYSPFANVDNTPFYQLGVEGTTGQFTHSFRFQFLHFANAIADAVRGSNIINPAPEVEIALGGDLFGSSFSFNSGPTYLAPQATNQHNLQFKYDGGTTYRSHVFRYGFGINRILGSVFAKFVGLGPAIVVPSLDAATLAFANAGPFPGGDTNPLNYPAQTVILGNGQGYFTEIPRFNLPAGGQYDTRVNWYFGDAWKIRSNLTLSYGIHYVRDTGRSDSDLPAIPALDQFGQGLGNRVHQPNKNFSPIVGLAWDPSRNGNMVIRAGAGLYYENAVFNNVLFDRPGRLQKGLFFGATLACPTGSVALPNGSTLDTSALCGQPIGAVAKQLAADEAAYQAATIAAGPQANASYVGNALADGADSTGNNLIWPNYRTPFSWQFNAGFQRKIKSATMVSVDYVRNVGLHFLLAYDTNHVGDARYLNTAAALNAINTANAGFGCPAGSAGIDCAIAAGASIVDYASNGLDSGRSYLAGFPASGFGFTPDMGAAFPGVNPNLGENQMLFPIGRSVYNGLQVQLRQNVNKPLAGVRSMHLLLSYAFSRAVSQATDQDFINIVTDQRNINHYIGPNGLDRTHQLRFGGILDFPHAFRVAFTSKFDTALPLSLTLPASGASGEIFRTDVTGDGTTGDVLPGTNIGSFGRGVSASSLNGTINSYNSTSGGQLTPAGQALVSAGLFTPQQLVSLGATAPKLALAPTGQVGNDSFISTDFQVSYLFRPTKRSETFVIEPTISVYNLFNVANYGLLRGTLDGSGGSANGTTQGLRVNRITLGSGVFGFGAPRMLEWGVRISF